MTRKVEEYQKLTALFDKVKNCLETPGVDWGRPLEIVYQNEAYFLTKTKGHMTFASRGEQEYYPTRYRVFEVVPDKSRRTGFYAVELHEMEAGRKWKQVVADLTHMVDGLAMAAKKGKKK
jgi:hypothetical protein